ncbi:MAG: SDR family NAD(P)-dependent oxidoreductase [Bacteroidetes bacterium]|jgi:NAD(P)-dependent dehydrogenase (short-subunit alcohol dehydrogenase family)|nr:SDR family NAD(P)-dependent oxidoreductase [Bacteroidota bacterium]
MKRNILVTGANRGIGLEIVKQLVNEGHQVIATARDIEKLKSKTTSLKGNLLHFSLDVTDPASVALLKNSLTDTLPFIDVLINNAGIISSNQGPMASDMKEVRALISTNLLGPWRLSQALLPLLEASQDARIVNISSGMGAWDDLTASHAAYRMSKVSLNALTVMMASELEGRVTVNSMCPGWVKTDMGGPNAQQSVEQGADTAVWLSTREHIPTGKFFRDRKEIPW